MVQTYSTVVIDSCQFTSNHAADDGGAIYMKSRSTVTMNHCHFKSNPAEYSGGSVVVQTSDMVIESSTFEDDQYVLAMAAPCVL